jgi:phenylacetic acid degradation protein PaaD
LPISPSTRKRKPTPQQVANAMYAMDVTSHALNITISVLQAGQCQAQMVVRDDMVNTQGTCHGGMIFTLADTAFAYACNSENDATVASAASITFLRPARLGECLSAECLERAREKRNGLYDVTVTGDDGHVVAVFQGTSRTIKGESVPGLDHEGGSVDTSETEISPSADNF